MKIRIVAPHMSVVDALADQLEALGHLVVDRAEGSEGFELRFGESVALESKNEIRKAILPFDPPSKKVYADLPVDAEILLGKAFEDGVEAYEVTLGAETEAVRDTLADALASQGFLIKKRDECNYFEKSLLGHKGGRRYPIQLAQWLLGRCGIVDIKEMVESSADDKDIEILVQDPARMALEPMERFEVRILTDDPAEGERLASRMREAGFAWVTVGHLAPEKDSQRRFSLEAGPFGRGRWVSHLTTLFGCIQTQLMESGVDATGYPLEAKTEDDASEPTGVFATVLFPIAGARSGSLRHYGGHYPDSFNVKIYSQSEEAVAGLKSRLAAAGFAEPAFERDGDLYGFGIKWGAANPYPLVTGAAQAAVREAMAELGVSEVMPMEAKKAFSDSDRDIFIRFPTAGVADGSLEEALAGPGAFELTLIPKSSSDKWTGLVREFSSWGFKPCGLHPRLTSFGEWTIQHDQVPERLIDRIANEITTRYGVTPRRMSGGSGKDIWLHLPDEPKTASPDVQATDGFSGGGIDNWFPSSTESAADARPFIDVQAQAVRIGAIVLPRRSGQRHQLAPSPAIVGQFCLDGRTAETLQHIATSVALREPCLLEGETSTSKTSSIQLVAALLDQPLVRINLNGQSDTGELIGRFVPQHLTSELPIKTEELQEAESLLETETRMILDNAEREARPLTQFEVQQVMSNEGLRPHPWRWQDGLVTLAMKLGWWVLLDEVNLAEPQILERMNSVLEFEPSLSLTEYDNSLIGHGGIPVHPDFRIFATMNPAEYAGRTVLSPAYRDRWRGYRFVATPSETEYADMLRLLVFGHQPDIRVDGFPYAGVAATPSWPQLAALPAAEHFIVQLARFHASLEAAAGQGENGTARIGARRKERYVFTRRSLLSLLAYLGSPVGQADSEDAYTGVRQALVRYYLNRIKGGEDRQKVVHLLDANGIGPGVWRIGLPPVEAASGTTSVAEDIPSGPCTVSLMSTGDSKVELIKVLRRFLKLGLKQAFDLTHAAPVKLVEGVSRDWAIELQAALNAVGTVADVSMSPLSEESASSPSATADEDSSPGPYKVWIRRVGEHKVLVVQALHELLDISIEDALELVSKAPVQIAIVSYLRAERYRATLSAAGAVVDVMP